MKLAAIKVASCTHMYKKLVKARKDDAKRENGGKVAVKSVKISCQGKQHKISYSLFEI